MYNTQRAQELVELAEKEINSFAEEWRARCERKGKTQEQTEASVKKITEKRDRIVAAIGDLDVNKPDAIDVLNTNPIIANEADAVEASVNQLLGRI